MRMSKLNWTASLLVLSFLSLPLTAESRDTAEAEVTILEQEKESVTKTEIQEDETLPSEQKKSEDLEPEPVSSSTEDTSEEIHTEQSETDTEPAQEDQHGEIESDTSSEESTKGTEEETNEEIEHEEENLEAGTEENVTTEENEIIKEDVTTEKKQGTETHQVKTTQNIKPTGLLDVDLFGSSRLRADYLRGDTERVRLRYTGSSVLSANLLSESFVYFQIPEEVLEHASSISVSFNVPLFNLPLLPPVPHRGTYSSEDIWLEGGILRVPFPSRFGL